MILSFITGCATAAPAQPQENLPKPCLAIAFDLDATGQALAAQLSAAPRSAGLQQAFARHLADFGHPDAAIAHFRCALMLDPGVEGARVELAAQLIGVGAFADAEAQLARAGGPADLQVRSLRATALEGLGRLAEAAEQLAAAAEETGTSAVLYRRAADLYARSGDEARADDLKARADALDPPPTIREMRPLREARPKKKKARKKKRR